MKGRKLLLLTASVLGPASLTPVAASAANPTCSQLATLLAGQPFISQTPSDNQGLSSPTATIVPATATHAAYCKVHFQYSQGSGTNDGYADGQSQAIGITVGLPLSSTDSGTPSNPAGYTWIAVNGAWNGKVENLGGGGNIGTIGSTTSATDGGYVGSSTDGGHNNAEIGTRGDFGVIQATNRLNVGKINDYVYESIHQQFKWSLWLTQQYYGRPAQRNYWNGCSTGGRQGLELAGRFGSEFDGFLVGAPATYLEEFQDAEAWPALVNRDDIVGTGHPALTNAQYTNAAQHAIAACDVQGLDTVADGVVDDPRQCKYVAHLDPTILLPPEGTCSGSNCVDMVQATAIDKIWDGPRNHTGVRFWHPWPVGTFGGLIPAQLGPAIPQGQLTLGQNVSWDHRDLNFDAENVYSTRDLARANPLGKPAPIALEDEYALASKPGNLTTTQTAGPETIMRSADYAGIVRNVYGSPKRGKIIMWQGGADNLIFWYDSIEYYRNVATTFGNGNTDFQGTQSWFRYYHAPGVGHCGGGVGASPLSVTLPSGQTQIFTDLVNWVENGIVPQSAGDSTHEGILARGPGAFGTRPICPWPTTAIYNGSGSNTVASNYHCGGNLDAFPPNADTNNVATICLGLHTKFGVENSDALNYTEQGIKPNQCPVHTN